MEGVIKASENRGGMTKKYPMHMHDTYEIYQFLSGDVDYYVEGNCYPLKPGDLILIRKSESHKADIKCEGSYGRRVVNFDVPILKQLDPNGLFLEIFDGRPLGTFNHYSSALFPDNHWSYYIQKIRESEEFEAKFAYLLALLAELSECYKVVRDTTNPRSVSNQVSAVITYINQNLCEELSLSLLCDRFYLSKAHLNRIFKQVTGATIWNYILLKRLLLARELLDSGGTPTEVFVQCGFRDYTTFYRAYKKQFGVSPKQHQRV